VAADRHREADAEAGDREHDGGEAEPPHAAREPNHARDEHDCDHRLGDAGTIRVERWRAVAHNARQVER
jgi:hypothetical protein